MPKPVALLEDREQVPVVVGDVEDALAALAVERLHDHLAAHLGHEIDELRDLARDQRLGHQVGEVHRVELLVGGENAFRAVQHERAAAEREDLRGGDVGDVDGRVLALEDDVELVVEAGAPRRPERRVVPDLAPELDGLDLRRDAAIARPRDPLGSQ